MKSRLDRNILLLSIVSLLTITGPPVLAVTPNVVVTAAPNNPPVQVQPTGGNVDFEVTLDNNESTSQDVDLWYELTSPGGVPVGLDSGPISLTLPGGWYAGAGLTQFVDGGNPAGIYLLNTNVGLYPSQIFDSSSFEIEILPGSDTGWFNQSTGSNRSLYGIDFVDPDNGWVVGMTNTIMHTTDGGDNWHLQAPPPSSNYYAVHFINATTGWAVGDNAHIVHTTDAGATWINQSFTYNFDFRDVHFTDAQTGWIAGGKVSFYAPPRGFIYKTIDGGANWTKVFSKMYISPLTGIHFVDSQNGWALSGPNVLRTWDGGATWTELYTRAPGALNGLVFVDSQNGWVVGENGAVLHTSDGGDTWTQQDTGITLRNGDAPTFTDVSFVDQYSGWVVGGAIDDVLILHTSDGGATWQKQQVDTGKPLFAVDFVDYDHGWASGYLGEVEATRTGGE